MKRGAPVSSSRERLNDVPLTTMLARYESTWLWLDINHPDNHSEQKMIEDYRFMVRLRAPVSGAAMDHFEMCIRAAHREAPNNQRERVELIEARAEILAIIEQAQVKEAAQLRRFIDKLAQAEVRPERTRQPTSKTKKGV